MDRNPTLRTRIALLITGLVLASSSLLFAAEKSGGSIGLHVVPTATGELVVLNVVPGAPPTAPA